jgi:hypothetical protein
MTEKVADGRNHRGVETLDRRLQPLGRELRIGGASEVEPTLLLLRLSLWFGSDLDVRDLLESQVRLHWCLGSR